METTEEHMVHVLGCEGTHCPSACHCACHTLAQVTALAAASAQSMSSPYQKWLASLVRDPDRLGGMTTFGNARLSVVDIGLRILNGVPIVELTEDYPYLTAWDLKYAPVYAQYPDLDSEKEQLNAWRAMRKRHDGLSGQDRLITLDGDETIRVDVLAQQMGVKRSLLVEKLWSMGLKDVTANHSIDCETAQILAIEYGCEVLFQRPATSPPPIGAATPATAEQSAAEKLMRVTEQTGYDRETVDADLNDARQQLQAKAVRLLELRAKLLQHRAALQQELQDVGQRLKALDEDRLHYEAALFALNVDNREALKQAKRSAKGREVYERTQAKAIATLGTRINAADELALLDGLDTRVCTTCKNTLPVKDAQGLPEFGTHNFDKSTCRGCLKKNRMKGSRKAGRLAKKNAGKRKKHP